MSIPKISGQQARELIDIWAGDVEGLTFAQLGADRSYGDLFGAAPALAETVAWLYGRQSGDGLHITLPNGYDVWTRDGVVHLEFMEMTPDGAMDLARALLSAAEEARRG